MIYIVTALPCEASPLHAYFGCQRDMGIHPWQVFRSERISIIASGVGKTNSAAASAYLAGLDKSCNDIWLNVGVAGHASFDIGSLHIASRIIDVTTQRAWYPHTAFISAYSLQTLQCHDVVTRDYPDNDLVDMESSGFVEAGERFTTLERLHAIKIISDNRDHSVECIDKAFISRLIAARCEAIEAIIQALQQYTEIPTLHSSTQALYAELIETAHYSYYQRQQLSNLLQRAGTLGILSSSLTGELATLTDAKQILRLLQQQLSAQRLQAGSDD